jgi:hypothetical protein
MHVPLLAFNLYLTLTPYFAKKNISLFSRIPIPHYSHYSYHYYHFYFSRSLIGFTRELVGALRQ